MMIKYLIFFIFDRFSLQVISSIQLNTYSGPGVSSRSQGAPRGACSVRPKCYGGTERIVSYLTEELIRQGHEVTLYASGDSVTNARLVAACTRSLRLEQDPRSWIYRSPGMKMTSGSVCCDVMAR